MLPWYVSRQQVFTESRHVNLRELDEIVNLSRDCSSQTLLPLRLVNSSDSAVSIGAWAKGRSPSYRLNSRLRKAVDPQVLYRKQISNAKVSSKGNPSDDPSRLVALRKPDPCPKWLQKLSEPQPTIAVPWHYRRYLGGACRECFAGCGALSAALARKGCWVEPALEACPHKRTYIRSSDLGWADVRNRLKAEIRSGFLRYAHFGLPCKGWASANRLNGGTRRKHCPDGGPDLLPREATANFQGTCVVELCVLLHRHGGFFTIENPGYSDFWNSTPFKDLCSKAPVTLAKAPLCSHGLVSPSTYVLQEVCGIRSELFQHLQYCQTLPGNL